MNYAEIIVRMEQDYADNLNSAWLKDMLALELEREPAHDMINVLKGIGFEYRDVKRRAVYEQLEGAVSRVLCGDRLQNAEDVIAAAVFDDDYSWMTERWVDDMPMSLEDELAMFGKL